MNKAKANFSFSYDYLMMKVGDVVGYMERDLTEFIARGVTQLDIDAFETQGNTFEEFPTNDFYQGMITIEVQAKNEARSNSTIKARKIAGIVEQVFGNKSGQYKTLGYGQLTNMKDDSFITAARRVAKSAENFLADLTGAGLTQAMLDALIAEVQLMEDKLHAVAMKEGERDTKTEERITLANALYDNLVRYCGIGKSIWEDVSEAKYNDYVINPSSAASLPKPQGLIVETNPINPLMATLTWNPVVDATEYEIYLSQVSAGDPAGEFSHSQTVAINSGEEPINPGFRYYFKVRAKNASAQSAFSSQEWIEA